MEAEGVSVEIADIFLGIASFFTVALGNLEIFKNTRARNFCVGYS